MGFTYNEISIKLNRTNKSIKEKSNKLGYISVIPKKRNYMFRMWSKIYSSDSK